MRDYLKDNWFPLILLSMLLALIAFATIRAKAEIETEKAFMRECLEERKIYECTYMWRSNNSRSGSSVILMPAFK